MNTPYIVKKFRRSKRVRILVRPDGEVLVTAPYRTPLWMVQRWVLSKQVWIDEKVNEALKRKRENGNKKVNTKQEYKINKAQALHFVVQRLRELNRNYGFVYQKVSVRNQSTRWGSCSRKGNLNFHFKVAQLPPRLRDYIIVHELCHLKELNHSPQFWDEVARTIPEHKIVRKELKRYSLGA